MIWPRSSSSETSSSATLSPLGVWKRLDTCCKERSISVLGGHALQQVPARAAVIVAPLLHACASVICGPVRLAVGQVGEHLTRVPGPPQLAVELVDIG